MGVYIKNWSLTDWKELLKWAKIGANNAMIGEFTEVEELPPYGDLISRKWLIDIALHLLNTAKNDDIANGVKWLWQYIIEAPTIIPASEEAE